MSCENAARDRDKIDLALLRHKLMYEPEVGIFYWRNPSRGVLKGSRAGAIDKRDGYLKIGFCGRTYPAHRLAWFYVHGYWPKIIDHIDRDRSNNKLTNLRDCDSFGNAWNVPAQRKSKSGVKGVYWNKASKKWHAQAMVGKKKYSLGLHESIEEAKSAYDDFCRNHHGEFFYENTTLAKVAE